jgi:putative DNA primase/helicase
MAIDFAKLSDKFRGNAVWGIAEHLANRLNVSVASLDRLGLGYVPIVELSKGPNYDGFFCLPQRDADGFITGISLRGRDDFKCMYPGSKLGLFYEVNPEHRQGVNTNYDPGPQNWVRADSDHICPICNQGKGCLISTPDCGLPAAAICVRVKEGASRPMLNGYLHHLDGQDTADQTASPLPPSEGSVLIVEGASDVAAAMDMGFVAVGRPSAQGGIQLLPDLIRGRQCIIVGENDQKKDGKCPGREGMYATFDGIKRAAKGVRMVMPPPNIKDLRAWRAKHRLTKAQFLEYVAAKGMDQIDNAVLPDDMPTTIARRFLADLHRLGGRLTLRRWGGEWYIYNGTCYERLDNERFLAPMYQWAYGKLVAVPTGKGENFIPLKMKPSLRGDVAEAAISETLVPEKVLPVWINNTNGDSIKDLIVFKNGVLNARKFLAGVIESVSFAEPTPDFFTVSSLPHLFDSTAKAPKWEWFLNSTLGDDPDKVALLQEWFGYCLVPDTSLQKMMFFRGPPSAGKGTILAVLRWMIGDDQSAVATFDGLAGPFGLAPLVNKLICVLGDVQTPKGADANRGLEVLLGLTGEDSVTINRKNVAQIPLHDLYCRITMAANRFIDVPDYAGAMARRLNIIDFTRSFKENPDTTLRDSLRDEIPGIIIWSLTGLKRIRHTKKFTTPRTSRLALDEWRVYTSPIAGFLEECCRPDPEERESQVELFDCWVKWSEERRISPMPSPRFFEGVRFAAPYTTVITEESAGRITKYFEGLRLRSKVAKQFLGRPER